jgi:hypothetical protein
MTTKQSGTAARVAREILTAFSGEEVLRKLSPSAIDLVERKVTGLEKRLDYAHLLLRVMVAMQVATLGLVLLIVSIH